MALACRAVPLGKEVRGLVVRPRPGGGPEQVLVFTEEGGVHELEWAGASGEPALGPKLASVEPAGVWSPAYDPVSNAVFAELPLSAISKLDASNRTILVAGSNGGHKDGMGTAARFSLIISLAADGKGSVWVADVAGLRRLDTLCGAVTTLAGAAALRDLWSSLAHNPANTGTLWAATRKALCRVRTHGDVEDRVELVAGDWAETGSVDGGGTAARFEDIRALLPVSGGRLLIADGADLRCMDAGGAVTTLLRGCFLAGAVRQMALLPSGELAAVTGSSTGSLLLISGGSFASQAQQPQRTAASTECLLSLLAPPAEEANGAGGSGGGGAAAPSAVVTVRVGDRTFPVQRSVLAAGSEYFARLLAPGGGFAESGATVATLQDADPAAFAHLLSYMYCTALGAPSQLLAMPPELLRPTTALAGRLLMDGAVEALTERLAAAATPASVLSDLAWADAHGMTDLAERLRAFAVRKRKAVDPAALEEFGERCPQQAGKLLRSMVDL